MRYQNLEIHNVAELLEGDGSAITPASSLAAFAADQASVEPYATADAEGLWCSRVPNALRLSLNPKALVQAVHAAGAELRFNQHSESVRFVLKCNEAPGIAEVYQGSFMVGWHVVGTTATPITVTRPPNLDVLIRLTEEHRLPFDARLTRVLLPWRPPVRILSMEGDFEPPQPGQTPKRYLAYGSSITHGSTSIRPTGMYAARTAQLLGADLINLGFGGGAYLEPQMAEYIASRTDWDFATLETGINIPGMGPEKFGKLAEQFISTIAGAHRDKWIFCTGVYTCGADYLGENWAAEYREVIKEIVSRLNLPRLVYVDGRALLPSLTGLTTDLIHPSPAGMEEMARNLSAVISKTISPV